MLRAQKKQVEDKKQQLVGQQEQIELYEQDAKEQRRWLDSFNSLQGLAQPKDAPEGQVPKLAKIRKSDVVREGDAMPDDIQNQIFDAYQRMQKAGVPPEAWNELVDSVPEDVNGQVLADEIDRRTAIFDAPKALANEKANTRKLKDKPGKTLEPKKRVADQLRPKDEDSDTQSLHDLYKLRDGLAAQMVSSGRVVDDRLRTRLNDVLDAIESLENESDPAPQKAPVVPLPKKEPVPDPVEPGRPEKPKPLDEPEPEAAVENTRMLPISELRELAKSRGIPHTGAKSKLLKRLEDASDGQSLGNRQTENVSESGRLSAQHADAQRDSGKLEEKPAKNAEGSKSLSLIHISEPTRPY